MIKRILVFFRNLVYGLALLPYVLYYKNKPNVVFTECYMSGIHTRFKKNNWGDDLNRFLFEYVSDLKIVNLPFSRMLFVNNITPYSLIGSIITFYKLNNKIIYGTGVRNPNDPFKGKPQKIISVRGPRTRDALIAHGIECPECYGDPVLLLPLFYKPNNMQSNRGGLIVNMGTDPVHSETVKKLADTLNLKLISMTNYENWTDVVDEICSCDYIVSESLHGLIVAETYGIPNVWVEFINHPSYWDFKFYDFYESIEKEEQIIKLIDPDSIDSNLVLIKSKIDHWEKGRIDYKSLLDLYPFKMKVTPYELE